MGRLANALLRRLADRGEPPLPDPARDPRGHLVEAAGLPRWLAGLLLAELPPADAVAFGDAVGAPAPLALRANALRAERATVLERLRAERPEARIEASPVAPDALLARDLDALAATAAWREGLFAVEDTGAQVVVELCGARPGERILDACAGLGRQERPPGGARGQRRARRGRRSRAPSSARRAWPSSASASRA